MFHHILVPLDGSRRAEAALPIAVRIARAAGGSVHLIQVITLPIEYSGGLAPVPLVSPETIDLEVATATEYLKEVATRMPVGIETTSEVQYGNPAQRILETAERRGVDLLVVCSHGRTGFARWALGSVAHALAYDSTVPTLILRASESGAQLPGLDTAQPLCALIPLDGSPLAEAVLAPAASLVAALAAPAQGTLHLAQVIKIISPPIDGGEELDLGKDTIEAARERAREYLSQVAGRLQATKDELGLAITWSVVSDTDVASALATLAEQGGEGRETEGTGGCDLIAISTHGRQGLDRWVMGSVTDRLLVTAKLPMLIVRPPQHR